MTWPSAFPSSAARPRRSRFGRGKTFLELNAAQSGQLGVQGAGAWECWWWKYPARHQKVSGNISSATRSGRARCRTTRNAQRPRGGQMSPHGRAGSSTLREGAPDRDLLIYRCEDASA